MKTLDKKIDSYFKKYFDIKFIKKINNKFSNKHCFIFGATGALGQSLRFFLSHFKIKPKSITIFYRNKNNLKEWSDYAQLNNIKLIFKKFNTSLKGVHFDNDSVVFNFIGYAQPFKFMSDPESLFSLHSTFLINLVKKTPKYIFFASSSEIYSGVIGKATEFTPSVSLTNSPRSAYIESKKFAETILNNMTSNETRYVSFRIALATHPFHSKDDNRLLTDIVNKAQINKVVKIENAGNFIRTYQWGPLCIAKIISAGFFGNSNIYNISGGQPLAIKNIARKIAKFLKLEFINKDKKSHLDGAPRIVNVSSNLLEKELGVRFKKESFNELISIYLKDFG